MTHTMSAPSETNSERSTSSSVPKVKSQRSFSEKKGVASRRSTSGNLELPPTERRSVRNFLEARSHSQRYMSKSCDLADIGLDNLKFKSSSTLEDGEVEGRRSVRFSTDISQIFEIDTRAAEQEREEEAKKEIEERRAAITARSLERKASRGKLQRQGTGGVGRGAGRGLGRRMSI